jgi:hypothetical protein
VRLCPWADVVYGCDGPWWHGKNGLPKFSGTKLAHDTGVCATYRDVHKIEVRDHDLMLFDEPGVVGSGGNSGFQAINIAAQFGASRILLIGFDMHAAAGVHWYGHNGWQNASNPSDYNYIHWRQALTKQSRVLGSMGIDVVNASEDSALTCFRSSSVEHTLMDWNL